MKSSCYSFMVNKIEIKQQKKTSQSALLHVESMKMKLFSFSALLTYHPTDIQSISVSINEKKVIIIMLTQPH